MRVKTRALGIETEKLSYKDFAFLGNTNKVKVKKLVDALKFCVNEDLSPRQRQMIEMFYFQGVSKPKIAKELRLNKTTVYRTILRAERKIQKRLELMVKYD